MTARRLLGLCFAVVLTIAGDASADTTEEVIQRGYLKCGVQAGYEGFASTDQYGEWHGFDADFCRAVATAVVGDPKLVMFISADRQAGIDSLATGSADLVARSDAGLGGAGGPDARQVGVLLHDSFGLMVPAAGEIDSAQNLKDQTICTSSVRGAEEAVRAQLAAIGISAKLASANNFREPLTLYRRGECAAMSALRSDLAGIRMFLGGPKAHRILELEFGKAPGGPRVRGDDEQWASIVQWVLFALIEAEELGITQANAADLKTTSQSVRVRQLLGVEADTGSLLGLRRSWAYDVITQVGNYAEIYARSLGEATPLALPRTRSRLWNAGGMLFAPPVVSR